MKSLKKIIAVLSVCLMIVSCIYKQYDNGLNGEVENYGQQRVNETQLANWDKIYFNDSTNHEMITSAKGHQTVLK